MDCAFEGDISIDPAAAHGPKNRFCAWELDSSHMK